MKVKDLMEFLKESNPELPVVLSQDPEGNGFHGMGLAQEATFVPEKWGRVEVYNQEHAPKGAKPCVVLWPE
jgi:hypothetical protein